MRTKKWTRLIAVVFLCLFLGSHPALAQESVPEKPVSTGPKPTLNTLQSLMEISATLEKKIAEINQQITQTTSEAGKQELRKREEQLRDEYQTARRNFEEVAAGSDISTLRDESGDSFDLKQEFFQLLEPALKELKAMTSEVRKKSNLREKITYYDEKLPIARDAVDRLESLLKQSDNESVNSALKDRLEEWKRQLARINSERQSAQLQLNQLEASDVSFTEASQSYLKSFFQRRGLFLLEAMLVVAAILLLSRLVGKGLERFVPGYRAQHRSFRVRLMQLVHRVLTLLLAILGPMVVFYLVEDWVLFSIGILLLLGMGWTVRSMLPRYWHQVQLFLNIGSVREGERIFIDGLPWLVKYINVFSILENPKAELVQRVPIDQLVDLKSRPVKAQEPWFPCKRGDWVILSDDVRGKVTGISPEMVELIERGGAHKFYTMSEFLALSPRNLAMNFRIKETIGISYALQHESTTTVPDLLAAHIQRRVEEEGYGEQLLNLRVEFEKANSSSLDIVVIADFKGELGDLYNRLRRAIQRWCVDACRENGWEIPFPQLTVHGMTPVTQ